MGTPQLCAARAREAGLGGEGEGSFSSEVIVPIFGSQSQAVLLPLCFDAPTHFTGDVTNPRQSRQSGVLGFSLVGEGRQAAIFSGVCGRNKWICGDCYLNVNIWMRLFFSLNISLEHRSSTPGTPFHLAAVGHPPFLNFPTCAAVVRFSDLVIHLAEPNALLLPTARDT